MSVPLESTNLGPRVDRAKEECGIGQVQGIKDEEPPSSSNMASLPSSNVRILPNQHLSMAPVCVFQNLMQRSAVPPPVARRLP